MDGYTKGIVGMGVADNNQSDKFVRVLHRARLKWGMPACLRTDRGGENVLAQTIFSRSEVSITVVSLLESQYTISQLRAMKGYKEAVSRNVTGQVPVSFFFIFQHI